jgi:hypothetical protein
MRAGEQHPRDVRLDEARLQRGLQALDACTGGRQRIGGHGEAVRLHFAVHQGGTRATA